MLISSMVVLATLSIRLLPETRHRRLPDTIEEIRAWSSKATPLKVDKVQQRAV